MSNSTLIECTLVCTTPEHSKRTYFVRARIPLFPLGRTQQERLALALAARLGEKEHFEAVAAHIADVPRALSSRVVEENITAYDYETHVRDWLELEYFERKTPP